jgi:hypothetical protein
MGSSCHALAPLHQRLVVPGHAPSTLETSELLHYQRGLLVEATRSTGARRRSEARRPTGARPRRSPS